MGTQRCPVGNDRTNLASQAACRRSRLSVAGTHDIRRNVDGADGPKCTDVVLDEAFFLDLGCRQSDSPSLLFVQIFARNIIFWHLVRANFFLVDIPSALHSSHDVGLERVSFLDQFVHAL